MMAEFPEAEAYHSVKHSLQVLERTLRVHNTSKRRREPMLPNVRIAIRRHSTWHVSIDYVDMRPNPRMPRQTRDSCRNSTAVRSMRREMTLARVVDKISNPDERGGL